MTMCLREGGTIPDNVQVVSCKIETLGTGTEAERMERGDDSVGVFSCMCRVTLEYGSVEDPKAIMLTDLKTGEAFPKTMMVKVTPSGFGERLLGNLVGFFNTEVEMYKRDILGQVGMKAPKLYFAAHDDMTGARYILMIEDLAPRKPPKQHQGEGGFLIEHAKETASELTKLHSAYWNCVHEKKMGLSHGGFLIDNPGLLNTSLKLYVDGLEFGLDWIKNTMKLELSQQTLDYTQLLKANIDGYCKYREDYAVEGGGFTNCTLIHGDPRPENLFLNPLTFIDFQLAMETPPEHDLMWICMYGFESKYRRTHEIDLLFHYHAELGKRDIDLSKHTIENSAFHFADEAGFMFAQQIIAIKDMAKKIEQDPNMGAMFVTVLKRLDIFIQDWDIANMLRFHLNRVNTGKTKEPVTNDDWRSCIPEAQLSKIDSYKASLDSSKIPDAAV